MLFNNKYVSIKIDESKLKERNKELSIFLEMSNFLSTPMKLKDLLEGSISRVMEHFDLKAGRIYLVDDSGKHLYLAAHKGMKQRGLEKLNFDESFSGKAVRTRSFIAQHVTELQNKKRVALLLSKGIKIIICIPLISMDRIVGVMNLSTDKIIELDQNKIDLFMIIGNQIAVAVNNVNLYQELRDSIKILKEKKEMIKFFSYTIAHDLKSPATAIYGLTKRLKEKYAQNVEEKGKAYIEQILKAARQMVDLVDNINAYIATKESSLNFQKIKVKEITEAIRGEFFTQLKQRHIKWSEPDFLPEIIADELSLSRVFRNFAENALKYGGQDMLEIKIGYEENESFHIFSFSDDGVGLKVENRDKVFELFRRDETSKGTSGSGLGLAIVKEMAERHQGHVWLAGGGKKGITFYISIAKDLSTKAADSSPGPY